jgi:formylglycine-generating enzyme required for sulfatase activity
MKVLLALGVVGVFLFGVVGCGGGGSSPKKSMSSSHASSAMPLNSAPSISMESEINAVEGQLIVIAPTISDVDGSVAKFQWSQNLKSTYLVTYSEAPPYGIQFVAPQVGVEGGGLIFDLEVIDDEGLISRAAITVNVSSAGIKEGFIDTDGDGIEDSQDMFPSDKNEFSDVDNDGIGNKKDNCPFIKNKDQADSDADGVGDLCELNEKFIISGIFFDAPTSGISYSNQSGNISGITDANGKYFCNVNDIISFNLGEVELGKTNCSSLISPFDLVSADSDYYKNALNIAQLLQSLDKDKDPSNGIYISPETVGRLQKNDFSIKSSNLFQKQLSEWLIKNDDLNLALVDLALASNHLQNQYRNSDLLGGMYCDYYSDAIKNILKPYNSQPNCKEYELWYIYNSYLLPNMQENINILELLKVNLYGAKDDLKKVADKFISVGNKLSEAISSIYSVSEISDDKDRSSLIKVVITSSKFIQLIIDHIINTMSLVDSSFNPDKNDLALISKAVSRALNVAFSSENCLSALTTGKDSFPIECLSVIDSSVDVLVNEKFISIDLGRRINGSVEAANGLYSVFSEIKKAQDLLTNQGVVNNKKLVSALFVVNGVVNSSMSLEETPSSMGSAVRNGVVDTLANVTSIVGCFKIGVDSFDEKSEQCIKAATGVVSQYLNGVGASFGTFYLSDIDEQLSELRVVHAAVEKYMLYGGRYDILNDVYQIDFSANYYSEYIKKIASSLGLKEKALIGGDYDLNSAVSDFELYLNMLNTYVSASVGGFNPEWNKVLIVSASSQAVYQGESTSVSFVFDAPSQLRSLSSSAKGISVGCFSPGTNYPAESRFYYKHNSDLYYGIASTFTLTVGDIGVIPVTCEVRSLNNTVLARQTFSLSVLSNDNDTQEENENLIPENKFPIADAGPDQFIFSTQEIILDALKSYDVDGSIVSYSWYENNRFIGSGKNINLNYRVEGVYKFLLRIDDNEGYLASDTVVVNVKKPVPRISSSPAQLTFGDVSIGQSKTLPLTIRNSGSAALTNISLSVNSAEFALGAMPTSLAAGEEAVVQVTFTPEAEVSSSAAITIKSKELADAKVQLTGSGFARDLLLRVIPSATTLKVNDELKLRLEITDGNPAYTININWGDGKTDQYNSSQSEVFASHAYIAEAKNTLKVSIVDAANETREYTTEINVTNEVITNTAWGADARHITTSEYAANIPITVNAEDVQGATLQTFTTNWQPKAGSNNNYFVKYRLPVPSGVIKLTNNVRMTVIMSASNVASYDRELAFVTDKGELAASWIAEVEPPIPGYIRVKDFNSNDVKFESGLLNDDPQLKPIQSYAIEWRANEREFSAQRYANSAYSQLEKLGYVAQNSLNEINITFKGNGKIYLVKLEYDKNGNGEYDDGYIVANTADKNIDWSVYGGADIVSAIEPQMVSIPAGSFIMGDASSGMGDEIPVHAVTISNFFMSKYEVTYAEFDTFSKATGRELVVRWPYESKAHPVRLVSWRDAMAYVQWLNQKTGKLYRLPTEAEWEYVARSGSTTSFFWGDVFDCKRANNLDLCGIWGTQIGGTYMANSFGVFDMAGNVAEWTQDCFAYYFETPVDGKAMLSGDCNFRISRGGQWIGSISYVRSASRGRVDPNNEYDSQGFRLAQDVSVKISIIEPEMVPIPGTTYSMSKYETTFDQYDAYVEDTGANAPDDAGWGRGNRPVINVSWDDAVAYAEWLSQKTGKHYRLPTEEEWEFSARAGSTTYYSWGDGIGVNNANCNGCGSQWDGVQTAPVGSFQSNQFGLFDMYGNLLEFTSSCKPLEKDECGLRAVRGGAWHSTPNNLRWNSLNLSSTSFHSHYTGFRLVQDLSTQASSSTSSSSRSSESSANKSFSSINSSSLMNSSSSARSALQSSNSSTNSSASQTALNTMSGAWVASTTCSWENPLCNTWLIFLNDEKYFSIQTTQPDEGCKVGVELGSYTHNTTTGAFHPSPQIDTNDHCGVSDASESATVIVEGNQLAYKEAAGLGSVAFIKPVGASDYQGTWAISENNRTEVLVITGSDYVLGIYDVGVVDVEQGNYFYNSATGAFVVTQFKQDKNPARGFTGASNIKFQVSGATLTITTDLNPSNPQVFSRLQ